VERATNPSGPDVDAFVRENTKEARLFVDECLGAGITELLQSCRLGMLTMCGRSDYADKLQVDWARRSVRPPVELERPAFPGVGPQARSSQLSLARIPLNDNVPSIPSQTAPKKGMSGIALAHLCTTSKRGNNYVHGQN